MAFAGKGCWLAMNVCCGSNIRDHEEEKQNRYNRILPNIPQTVKGRTSIHGSR